MNLSKLTLFFILTLLVNIKSYSQDNIDTYTDVVPPSPTAGSLGIYGQVPVGMFTGTAQFNIPLYQLNSRKLSLSISLNYSTNGVKVDQISSWVGMGWSLNAGGVITRMVRDRQDESSIRVPFENVENQYDFDPEMMEAILMDPLNEEMDTEPDLYSYNFNGMSGKFIIDTDGYPRLIPYQDVKIEVIGTGTIRTFEITTKDGVKYYFGVQEEGAPTNTSYEKTKSQNSEADGRDGISNYYTAWYLTQMAHPTGDTINFKYENKLGGLNYDSGISQHFSVSTAEITCIPCVSPGSPITSVTELDNSVAVLREISTDNILISFERGSVNALPEYKLEGITIKEKNNPNVERRFDFSYDLQNTNLHVNEKSDNTTTRMFLSELTETGTDIISPKKHSFGYIEPEKLPVRLSFTQDHWGYYNGKSFNSSMDIFIPKASYLQSYFPYLNGADRDPNWNYAKYGSLNKITYPTGGTSEIEYEPHQYWGVGPASPEQVTYVNYYLDQRDINGSGGSDQETINIPNNQESIYFMAKLICTDATYNCDGEDVSAMVTIKRSNIIIFRKTFDYEISDGDFVNQEYNELVSNLNSGDYTIELQIDSPHSNDYKVEIFFTYKVVDPGADLYQNIETGGIRVNQITSKESPSATPKIEHYYYGDLTDLNKSSATTPWIPNYYNMTTRDFDCNVELGEGGFHIPNISTCTTHHLSSNSNNSLFNVSSSHIAYRSVLKSYGENFENGGEYFKYIASIDTPGTLYTGNGKTPSIANSNTGWNAGTLLQQKTFKIDINDPEKYITLKNEEFKYNYEYESDSNNDESYSDTFKAGIIRRKHTPWDGIQAGGASSYVNCDSTNVDSRTFLYYSCVADHGSLKHLGWHYVYGGKCWGYPFSPANNIPVYYNHVCYGKDPNAGITIQYSNRIGDFDINLYDVLARWEYLKQKKTTIYNDNGLNPITTTVDYEYNNVNHAQVSKTITINSKGESIVQKMYYPLDYDYECITELQPLVYEDFKGVPIDIRTEINGKLLSGQLLKYNEIGQVIELHQAESELGTVITLDPTNPYSYGEGKFTIGYNATTGNIEEYYKENDVSTVLLWAYNNTYPVAKIQNASLSEIITAMNSVSTTFIDDLGVETDKAIVGGRLEQLRTTLASDSNTFESMVSSFVYDPLKGVVMETAPNGLSTHYQYDDLNRLKAILNNDQEVLQYINYYYAGEPNISLSLGSYNFGGNGGSKNISVTSNRSWTATENVGWLSISSGSGSNNGTFTITATNNTGLERDATVTVTAEGISKFIHVSQDPSYSFDLSGSRHSLKTSYYYNSTISAGEESEVDEYYGLETGDDGLQIVIYLSTNGADPDPVSFTVVYDNNASNWIDPSYSSSTNQLTFNTDDPENGEVNYASINLTSFGITKIVSVKFDSDEY